MSGTRSIRRGRRPARMDRGGQRSLSLALLVIATAQLMVVLDSTIANVALPPIQRALGFSGSGLEWVVNAYALAFGLLLLGGLATTQEWLVVARALQGIGAAIGLLAGGLLTTCASWRWVLFVNVPIGVAVAFAAYEARNFAGVPVVDKDPATYVREAEEEEGLEPGSGSLSIGSLKRG